MEIPSLRKLEDEITKFIKLIVQLRHENQILRSENARLRGKLEKGIVTSSKPSTEEEVSVLESENEVLKQDSEKIRAKVEHMLSKFEELEL